MKIEIKQVVADKIDNYHQIPMIVEVRSIYKLEKIENGLGGILLREIPVKEYSKDLGAYDNSDNITETFDTRNWAFFIAYDSDKAVGGAIVAARTHGMDMLDNRIDMTVLWDLRVDKEYQQLGIGHSLFKKAEEWSRDNGYKQMKIECQNNNVKACKFYAKHGAILSQIKEYAYQEEELKDEVQFIWHLDL